ncbi:MAG: aldo/keto reductase [Ruminococcus sp.]|nr:aldo/keto reductase [Ruminococcus sp.]
MNNIPKIAMGAWAWGNDGTFGDNYTLESLKAVYETAVEKGLNLWDTAVVYGMGTSEKILGELSKETVRDNLIFSTKFTPQIEDKTPDAMQNMLNGSKERLHTDTIDIYWIHNPMDVEKYTPMIIPLAQSGQIRQIGVSNHNLAEILRANEILGKAGLKISAVQNHYSILNRSSEESGILDYCKKNDIVFYSYMVLEQGALSGNYNTKNPFPENSDRGRAYNPIMPDIEKLTQVMKSIGIKHNINTAQVAIAWSIAKGTVPIVGVTKVHHVEDAAQASNVILTEEEIRELETTADSLELSTIRYWEKKME